MGRDAVMRDFFRVPHNSPSTPECALSGEVRERTIWGYWAQGYDAMPAFMKLCVDTWRRHNPRWDVRILQKSTILYYLSEVELPNRFMHMLSHQTASDCVRLALLSRYGGIWMDVNILLLTDLDSLCWDEIAYEHRDAAVFYHPHYGTDALFKKDLVESWFLAARPGNPFFIKWRDLLRELMHNRLDVDGLLRHPLYQGLDLSGIHRMNMEFGADFDFREYLAIHAMCHRLLETDARSRSSWQTSFLLLDAAASAFRMQLGASAAGKHPAEVLLNMAPELEHLVETVPLIKFTTPHYGPLLGLTREQLLNPGTLLGRLFRRPAVSRRRAAKSSTGSSGSTAMTVPAAGAGLAASPLAAGRTLRRGSAFERCVVRGASCMPAARRLAAYSSGANNAETAKIGSRMCVRMVSTLAGGGGSGSSGLLHKLSGAKGSGSAVTLDILKAVLRRR
eukprot:TRINITY_DN34485_c0_g2_i1.p1 TRINITY_DN34485_c0_g2~~TRINITY_DN34485_c0_g2_i1.p1  ORF type:complete len:449 (+),score=53.59 TRINITY_DN34485_c0_g2_i1:90-1436(+)